MSTAAHASLYVISDERGRMLRKDATPNDPTTTAWANESMRFATAAQASDWLALADGAAERPSARRFAVERLDAGLFAGREVLR